MDLTKLTPEQLEQLARAIISSNKLLTFGPFILGSLIDALLCGILLMQCGSYISSSARDGWLLKATVACVVTMNLWGTAFAWAWVWNLFVQNFGTYRTFFSVKYLSWTTVINTWNSFAVQMFFALRAWKILDRNRLFGVVLAALMLAFISSHLAIKILLARYPSGAYTHIDEIRVPLYMSLSSLVVGDLLITITILWNLLSWRGGNRRTDRLLKKLARVTFESQLPPTLVAITSLVVYTAKNNSAILIALDWALPKVYGISLLHTLNIRPELAQPTVVFGTTHAASSCTTGTDSLRFAVKSARTAQTGESDVIPRSIVISVSQSQSHFATPNGPQEPTVISFDKESVATTPGDTPKLDVLPAFSHDGSSDIEMEMVESKSRLPDLESRTTTTG